MKSEREWWREPVMEGSFSQCKAFDLCLGDRGALSGQEPTLRG